MQSPEPIFTTIAFVCLSLILIIITIFWLRMLIDAFKREDWPSGLKDTKILWVLVVFFAGWIGALIYYIVIYKKMKNNRNYPPSGPLGV